MKKILGMLLVLVLGLSLMAAALAEEIDISGLSLDELVALQGKVNDRIAELGGEVAPAEEAPEYPTLQKGSKGDDVKKLQQRLKDLNYLSGSVDGSYGNGTAGAVSSFQQEAGLEATGIADEATQKALFADDAPKSKSYMTLDYNAVARDPDAHDGDLITFKGKVLQVTESGSRVIFRIASKGNWDNVVYCTYTIPSGYKRILEDDKVTVYGTCTGVYTYTTVMGASVTIPACTIDRIELR